MIYFSDLYIGNTGDLYDFCIIFHSAVCYSNFQNSHIIRLTHKAQAELYYFYDWAYGVTIDHIMYRYI